MTRAMLTAALFIVAAAMVLSQLGGCVSVTAPQLGTSSAPGTAEPACVSVRAVVVVGGTARTDCTPEPEPAK